MKIDIHAHTKKTKTGDSEKRNIEPTSFAEIIKATDVKILAITNHNHFDYEQYIKFEELTKDVCQIWPGVELDIVEEERRGHLIVIVNPKDARILSDKMSELLSGTSEEKFTISIEDTIKHFDNLDSIYIPHYFGKKPSLTDDDIVKMVKLVKNEKRVIKEATNSISAGIYINHGHKSIYGSDVHNWDNYIEISEDLPELRLPVESFDQFCLLLEKNEPAINTLLDQKKHEQISIAPFESQERISINIFNDINILFGSKGTGKTEILRAISKYYNENGLKTSVYESSNENLNDSFDIKGSNLNVEIADINIDSCAAEISFLKSATEKSSTSLSNYHKFYSSKMTNARANSISIKNFTTKDTTTLERKVEEINTINSEIDDFTEFVSNNTTFRDILSKDLLEELNSVLQRITVKIQAERESRFTDSRATKMFNELIRVFLEEISKKTGSPIKPTTTGFSSYASNRIKIERKVNKIVDNIRKKIDLPAKYVGDLGDKGKLYCKTDLLIQDGTVSNGKFNSLKNINKNPQKEFSKKINAIKENIYSSGLFEKISDFTSIAGIEDIKDIDDLILFYRYFAIDNLLYNPSNGESSMLLLHNELSTDKEIYLLDEPEKSLGNDYINDVIVPLLKERAKMGKKIIVATHDANIAVRTLPYNSIYRKHEIDSYCTYTGNPFSNNLIELGDSTKFLDWKDTSMKTLEGGKEAFGERGKIYGNS